jgi:hypothetical protein
MKPRRSARTARRTNSAPVVISLAARVADHPVAEAATIAASSGRKTMPAA